MSRKKKILIRVGIIAGGSILAVIFLWRVFVYYSYYYLKNVDTATSPDGQYSVTIQSMGEPFLVGPADGRLVLFKHKKRIAQYFFELYNDGGPVSPGSWNVNWTGDSVEIFLTSYESRDELVTMYFDGHVDSHTVEKYFYGDTETLESSEDETQPETLDEETQRIMDGYEAIYHEIFEPLGDGYEESFTAKGMPRIILSEDDNAVRYLLYDRKSANGQCGIYVYYEADKQPDGTWQPAEARICNMYAYVYEDGRVITSNRTSWSDAGTDEYRQATGE